MNLRNILSFGKKKPQAPTAADRRFMRHECCVVATMMLLDKTIELEGLVLEVSRGGVLFRAASSYVLTRTGEAVSVDMLGHTIPGVIVASRATGYGIKLHQEMNPDFVSEIAERYPIAAMSAAAKAS